MLITRWIRARMTRKGNMAESVFDTRLQRIAGQRVGNGATVVQLRRCPLFRSRTSRRAA